MSKFLQYSDPNHKKPILINTNSIYKIEQCSDTDLYSNIYLNSNPNFPIRITIKFSKLLKELEILKD